MTTDWKIKASNIGLYTILGLGILFGLKSHGASGNDFPYIYPTGKDSCPDVSLNDLVGMKVDNGLSPTSTICFLHSDLYSSGIHKEFVDWGSPDCCAYRVIFRVSGQIPKLHQGYNNERVAVYFNGRLVLEADPNELVPGNECQMVAFNKRVIVDLLPGERVDLNLVLRNTRSKYAFAEITGAKIMRRYNRSTKHLITCYGKCTLKSELSNNSISFNLPFGSSGINSTNMGTKGCFRMTELYPNEYLCSTKSLQYIPKGEDPEIIFDTNTRQIRQVKGMDGLADIITIDNYQYDIKIYKTQNVLNKVGDYYQTQNNPEVTYTICNPNKTINNLNTLLVIENRQSISKTNTYEWNVINSGWTLTRPGDVVGEKRVTTWDTSGELRTETLEKFNPNTQIVDAKVTEKYRLYEEWDDNGDRLELIQEETYGVGTNALTTQYDYYTSTNDLGYMQLKSANYPGGNWEYKVYDNYNRPLASYSAFSTNDWSSVYTGIGSIPLNTNLCRTISYDYTLLSGASDNGSKTNAPRTTIEYVAGKEVSRSYLVLKDGEEQFIQCQTPGASWTHSSNLKTTKKYFTTGIFTNALQSVSHPDGTFELYDYYKDVSYRTNTVWRGEPNGAKTAVVDGTKHVSVYNAYGSDTGKPISETTYDIASGIKLSEITYSNYDAWNRPQTKTYLDGESETTTFGCCGIEAETDKEGTITGHTYDDIGREVMQSRHGILSETFYDSAGNVTKQTRTGSGGGTTITLNTSGYDLAGRMITQTNALGGVTTWAYSFGSSGESIVTQTNPDGGTRTETYCVDGQLEKVTGTASNPMRYEFGVEQLNGYWREYTKSIKLDSSGVDTSEWTKVYTDMVGRSIRTVYADSTTPYPYSESIYNSKGQLVRTIDPDGIRTLYGYNAMGEVEYTAIDDDQDSVLDYSGNDRIQRNVSDAVVYSSTDTTRAQTYTYQTNSSSTQTLVSEQHRSTDGLKSWGTVYRDGSTPVTTLTTVAYPTVYTNAYGAVITMTQTTTHADNTKSVQEYASGRLVLSQRKDTSNNVLTETAYEYDSHGRQSKIIDKRNGATTFLYNNADQVAETRLPSAPPQVTTTFYDTSLRVMAVDLPDGKTVYNEYFPTGQLKKTYGGPNYPVEYTYDAQGRMRTMKTWQDFDGNTGTATTRWNYDDYRGWLKSKDYPDKSTGAPPGTEGTGGPTYTYTDAGRLKTRVWKRNVTTTYNYNNLGDLTSVTYSDSTPSVTHTYKRHGLMATALKNGMTATMSYNDAGAMTSELYSGGTLSGHGMNYTYDTLLRLTNARAKVGLNNVDAFSVYDSATGRLQKMTHSDLLFGGKSANAYDINYGYENNSSLINQIDYGASSKFATTRTYDKINRMTSVVHSPSASTVPVRADYAYNTANQRTQREEADGSYWKYQYDGLGQVISGKKYWPDGTLVDGQDFEYAFDDIGNRITTGGRDSAVSTYDANYLNQYDDRTVAGKIDVMGTANPTASVTVNSNTATRKGDYFHYPLNVSNGSAPVDQSVTVTSNYGSTQSATSNVFVAETPEVFTYDADGNLLSDGRWNYTWDAENRLIEMDTIAGVPTSAEKRIEFEYDYKGRRIRKKVYEPNGGGETLVLERKYVYDGWNLQAELDGSDAVVRKYLWGPDLSGTAHGAGGVGGLLMICDIPSYGIKDYYFVGADGNGNVTVLVDADAGTVEGRYEYGPFGESLRVTGSAIAGENPFRFSSKYTDTENGFLYYGYRYYNPETGRWLRKDPISERGGLNVYNFVANNSIKNADILGLEVYFALYYMNSKTDPSRSFRRAARTWSMKIMKSKNWDIDCDYIILKGFTTEGDFVKAWSEIKAAKDREISCECEDEYARFFDKGAIFSHATKSGIEFTDGTLSGGDVISLPKLDWTPSGQLSLLGCNTSFINDAFCDGQSVSTSGQLGFSYFSESASKYIEIDTKGVGSSMEVYLHSFERGRNAWFGNGKAVPPEIVKP